MRSAVTTVSPAAGPLTWRGEPPSSPATRPPTAAATRPAWSGAPVARAMPRDRGRAMRKTAIEADTSAPAMRGRRGPVGGGLWGGWARSAEHTSELQSRENLVWRLLLYKIGRNNRVSMIDYNY